MESIYDVVARDIVEGVMGRRGIRFQPYLMLLFVFTFFVSLL